MRLLVLCTLLLTQFTLAAPPIRIGVIGAFTGTSSSMGLSMRQGIQLASETINAGGGVRGRPLQLISYDDGSLPSMGVRAALALSRSTRVDAVIGFVNTPVALPALDVLQAAQVPTLIAVATATELTQRHAGEPVHYVFRVAAPDALQAELVVKEAIRHDGLRKVAILADTSPYGRNGEQALLSALTRRGIRPLTIQRFAQHERELTPTLREARKAGAETLLTYALGPQLAAIANGMETLGWRVPLFGSWTLSTPNFIDHAGPNAEGARMVQTFVESSATPAQRAFVQRYRQRFHTRRIASASAAAQGYDATLLLAQALREADSLTPTAIVAALENLRTPVDGVVAHYQRPFSRTDHEALDDSVPLLGVVRNNQVTFAHAQDKNRPLPAPKPAP